MVYNAYNSTLIVTYLKYSNENFKSFFQICIFNIKYLSIIKLFEVQIYDDIYEKYYLHILNEFTIIIIFINGMIFVISLKEYQIITLIQAFDENEIDEDSELKINKLEIEKEKKIIIFNDFIIKLFGVNTGIELIEENINDDKYKFLELYMFNEKKYSLNYIEPLNDEGK